MYTLPPEQINAAVPTAVTRYGERIVSDKVMTMTEAVERFVPDGVTVALGTALEALIPFTAGHEMIRQGRRDLELVGPISDSLFDQLIGAGCVRRVTAAWVGNVSEGLGHCYRRAAEEGIPRSIEILDHTNFSIAMALWAAAWNVPSLPARTLLGSGILDTNPNFKVADGLVHVGAVRPDVAVVHVQRADAMGRAHAWGPLGVTEEAGLAAERIVLSCEELVDASVTLSDPNRILFPETKVVAVVHEPGGAHPSPVQGYFKRDHAFFRDYAAESRTVDGFAAWLKRWVVDVPDRGAYMKRLDIESLRVKGSALSTPVNFADE
jgi:glutaconate CoA-transferase subunit A